MSMKILSPAGNLLALKTAIFNGANEVYLGVNEFNARNNIDGFTMQTLKEAVDFAHIYGVKVNLAVNILFSDEELQSALDLVVDAFNMGVDYFIIQDLGLISLINKHYPEITIHASTQMGVHNLEGVRYVEKFGIRRVVLSRETPLKEVERIDKNSDIEIEYFAHGALCVSFSGNCYLSSYLFDASGNRGRCKQLCRLPYTLKKDGKKLKSGYLLSAKDFNMTSRLDDMKKAGVDVIKIEGRARRPFYVGTATNEYNKALNGQNIDQKALELAFNRGFNEGYFNGNSNVLSQKNNHVGVFLGKVVKVKGGKTFNEVFFSSKETLSPKSTLKFFAFDKEKTTVGAFDLKEIEPNVYRLTTTHTSAVGDEVRLIADAKRESEVEQFAFKRTVDVCLSVEENKPISATATIDNEKITVYGDILQGALNSPLTKEQFIDCFSKGEFLTANLSFDSFGKVFMPKSKLNEFRRKVFDECINRLTAVKTKPLDKIKIGKKASYKILNDYQIIENGDGILSKTNVIYSPQAYELADILAFTNKAKAQGKKPYLDTPNFALEKDVELLKEIIAKTGIGVVANNYYALGLSKDLIIGSGLNAYNTYTANVLGAPIMVAEGELCQIQPFAYMTLRHCPMKEHLNCSCEKCVYTDGYEYVTDSGKVLKLKRKKLSSCTFYLTD